MKCLQAWKKLKHLQNELKNIKADDLLHQVGLERHHHTMSHVPAALGIFALGAAVGIGVALILAPKSGKELREDLSQRVRGLSDLLLQKRETCEESLDEESPDEEHSSGEDRSR